MLQKKVLETIRKYKLIEDGERVVVGISGGPDSVCLLHILKELAHELNIELFAVHINHMLRGKESDGDEKYVVELCKKLGVPLFVKSVDIRRMSREKGISPEEAGREARYAQFSRCAEEVGGAKIAVAHNKNDQVETVLMRIIRGTGPDGLAGMDFKRGRIIRPLLGTERADIEKYCFDHSLEPRTDSSNLESLYTRNKVRLELIPYIKGLFDVNINDNIYKLSFLMRDDIDFVEDFAIKSYNQCILKCKKDEILLDPEKLKKDHPSITRRVLRYAVKNLKGNLKGIEYVHIDSILKLISENRTGAEVHLPCSLRASLTYGALSIYISKNEGEKLRFKKDISIPGRTEVEALGSLLEAEVVEKSCGQFGGGQGSSQNSMIQFFDYEMLKSGINIRNRRDGDIFKPYRSNGTKKLKKFFIDSKVPRSLRDKIPLIAVDNEVVWIIGYKTSDKFKVTENTKKVLKLVYREGVLCIHS
ncbi:MAG: tRNA lysidine(34) synthetase TilS [Clostridiales bacterium]|jgi:tRNA(Ile)-lysidine synthase|nr:tRNA lysidine(34) synthetase TilS [Eubacteriales bacterium]MDH7566251.1 tRNA lysidine(34) synthetase TilS [Clostridiales bacterium]